MARIKLYRIKGTDKLRLNEQALNAMWDFGLKQTVGAAEKLFRRSIRGWRHTVNITNTPLRKSGGGIYRDVGVLKPSGEGNLIYSAVNFGTPAHPIKPRPGSGGVIWYREHYIPGTRPGSINSRRSRSWGRWLKSKKTTGQKIEARGFDEVIAMLLVDEHIKSMEKQMAHFATKAFK